MFLHRLLLTILLTLAAPVAFLVLCANLLADEPCGKVCQAKIEEVTEEKSRWNVGCKEICVPRVVCPWAPGGTGITTFNFMKNTVSSGGCNEPECFENLPTDCIYCEEPRCGDVRCVRTLEREPYEVRRSVANWDTTNCMKYGDNCGCDDCNCDTCATAIDTETIDMNAEATHSALLPAKQASKSFWQFWK